MFKHDCQSMGINERLRSFILFLLLLPLLLTSGLMSRYHNEMPERCEIHFIVEKYSYLALKIIFSYVQDLEHSTFSKIKRVQKYGVQNNKRIA